MDIINAPVTHEMKYNRDTVDNYYTSNLHEENEKRREEKDQQRVDIFITNLAHYALVIVKGSHFFKFLIQVLIEELYFSNVIKDLEFKISLSLLVNLENLNFKLNAMKITLIGSKYGK